MWLEYNRLKLKKENAYLRFCAVLKLSMQTHNTLTIFGFTAGRGRGVARKAATVLEERGIEKVWRREILEKGR